MCELYNNFINAEYCDVFTETSVYISFKLWCYELYSNFINAEYCDSKYETSG